MKIIRIDETHVINPENVAYILYDPEDQSLSIDDEDWDFQEIQLDYFTNMIEANIRLIPDFIDLSSYVNMLDFEAGTRVFINLKQLKSISSQTGIEFIGEREISFDGGDSDYKVLINAINRNNKLGII